MRVEVAGDEAFVHTGGVPLDLERPAVVLIHGAGQDHSHFRFQTRALAHRDLSALAVDLPSHGRSHGAPLESIAEMSRWIISLLDALGIRRAMLAGHSMGSLIAVETAASFGDRVAGAVLTGSGDAMPVHPELQQSADAGDPQAGELITGWVHTGASRFGGHPQAGTWTRGLTSRLLQRESGALGSDLAACSAYDPSARAGAVDCPVVVIYGSADLMSRPQRARALAALFASVEIVELRDVGHDLVVERPDAVLDAVVGLSKTVFT